MQLLLANVHVEIWERLEMVDGILDPRRIKVRLYESDLALCENNNVPCSGR